MNMLRRMHRKIVVVDGAVAFVGGINYSADHLADFGPAAKQDYSVEIRGPLVAEIHRFTHAALAQGQRYQRGTPMVAPAQAAARQPRQPAARRHRRGHAGGARQRRAPQRHRAALPHRDPRRAPARGHRQRLFLSRLPLHAGAAPCGAPRRRRAPDPAGPARHADRQDGGDHAVPPAAGRRRADLRVLRAAAARQGRADGRRMGHRRLQQPRPAEPGAEPRGQRHHSRPRLQRSTCTSAWTT